MLIGWSDRRIIKNIVENSTQLLLHKQFRWVRVRQGTGFFKNRFVSRASYLFPGGFRSVIIVLTPVKQTRVLENRKLIAKFS